MTTNREFKFACPACHQHILSNVEAGGQVMSCPTCFQKLIIPAAPTGQTTRLILRAKPLPRAPATNVRTAVCAEAIPAPTSVGIVAAISGLIMVIAFFVLIR